VACSDDGRGGLVVDAVARLACPALKRTGNPAADRRRRRRTDAARCRTRALRARTL